MECHISTYCSSSFRLFVAVNSSQRIPQACSEFSLSLQLKMLFTTKMRICFVPFSQVFFTLPLALPLFSPLHFSVYIFPTPCPLLIFLPNLSLKKISCVVIKYLPLYSLCLCPLPPCGCVLCVSLVAYGRALTAPTPG